MSQPGQLTFPYRADARFLDAEFIAAPSNEAARRWLARPRQWPERRLILIGDPGRGKTHLLRCWARANGAEVRDGGALQGFPDAVLPRALAIDDADQIRDAAALLHLINWASEQATPLLLTARVPASCWPFALPDLASRLRASLHVSLLAPEDTLLPLLLARFASDRQLVIPPAIATWLLQRLPRDAGALADAVERLDRASLATGGRVTRTLALEIVAAIGDPSAPRDGEALGSGSK